MSIMKVVYCVLGSARLSSQSPVQVTLQSKLPTDPIEDPNTWAWGLHPDQGLDYKARDSLSLEVCLSNKEFTPLVGCSGYNFPLSVCISNPVLTTRDECAGNKYPADVCEKFPQLYSQPSCQDNLNAGACAAVSSLTLTPQCKSLLT